MSDFKRHLTMRAVEFLKRNKARERVKYFASVGIRACDGQWVEPGFGVLWTTVADVRAITRGWKNAYELPSPEHHYPDKEPRPLEVPTCPHCCVLLDELLEEMPPPEKRVETKEPQ